MPNASYLRGHIEALNLKVVHNSNITTDSTTIALQAFDEVNKPVQGSFSLGVVSTGNASYKEENALSIWATLLLTSEVGGHIEHPNYYFISHNQEDSVKRAKLLDNLLLTQGWRRFVRNPSAIYTPETSLNITGKLLNKKSQPLGFKRVRLFAKTATTPFLIDTLTDAQGQFMFNNLDFYGNFKYLIQMPDEKNKHDTRVIIDTIALPTAPIFVDLVRDTSLTKQQFITSKHHVTTANNVINKRGIVLKEVAVRAQKPIYSLSGGMRILADKIIGSNRFEHAASVKDIIESSNTFIKFDKENNAFYEGKRPVNAAHGFYLMIDGHLFSENDWLTTMDPNTVESVEIFLNGSMLGVANKGVIVVNTKNNNPYRKFTIEKGAIINTFSAEGYAVQREFYTPQRSFTGTNNPDLNQTVYWNPYVFTNESGKTILKFLQPKNSLSFRVTVEGLTADGRIGRVVYNYSANKQ